jgi:hypothetical protein
MGWGCRVRCIQPDGQVGPDVGFVETDVGRHRVQVGSDVWFVETDVGRHRVGGSRCRVDVGFVETDVRSEVGSVGAVIGSMSGSWKPMSGPM